MINKRESKVLLFFLSILFIPLLWANYESTSKVLNVMVIHRNDYVITHKILTKNTSKKYGGGALFNINYNGQQVEGSDGYHRWAGKGDLVKVYFNKKDLYDNGIVSEIIGIFAGRLLLLLILTILFFRRLTSYRQLNRATAVEMP